MLTEALATAVLDANSCRAGDEIVLLADCTCERSQPHGCHATIVGRLKLEGDNNHWLVNVYGTYRYVDLLFGTVISLKTIGGYAITPPCNRAVPPWEDEGKEVLTIASSLVRKHGTHSTPASDLVCQVSRCVCEKFIMTNVSRTTRLWVPLDIGTVIRDFLRQYGGLCLHQPGG